MQCLSKMWSIPFFSVAQTPVNILSKLRVSDNPIQKAVGVIQNCNSLWYLEECLRFLTPASPLPTSPNDTTLQQLSWYRH